MFIWIVIVLVCAVIFGFATDTIIRNKGYDESWFWWGFLFGLVALIVAAARPEARPEPDAKQKINYMKEQTLRDGGWECVCGRLNPHYTGTCACGRTKAESEEFKRQNNSVKSATSVSKLDNVSLDELKALKELLDIGVVTQEEFDAKKKQLLNL